MPFSLGFLFSLLLEVEISLGGLVCVVRDIGAILLRQGFIVGNHFMELFQLQHTLGRGVTFRVTRISSKLLLVFIDRAKSCCWFGLKVYSRTEASLFGPAAGVIQLFFLDLVLIQGSIFFQFRCYKWLLTYLVHGMDVCSGRW